MAAAGDARRAVAGAAEVEHRHRRQPDAGCVPQRRDDGRADGCAVGAVDVVGDAP